MVISPTQQIKFIYSWLMSISIPRVHDPVDKHCTYNVYIVICATISLHPPADLYLPSSAFVRFRDWQFMDVPQCTTTTRLRPDGFFIHFPRTTVELISATKHYALAVVQIIIFRTRLTRSLLEMKQDSLADWLELLWWWLHEKTRVESDKRQK